MGVPYNKLVAPAILYENSGITRERYAELLDRTHSSVREYKDYEDLNFYKPQFDQPEYHEGLYGLAELLCLDISQEFIEFQSDDESPCLAEDNTVIMNKRTITGDPRILNLSSSCRLFEGAIITPNIVAEILSERFPEGPFSEFEYRVKAYPYELEINQVQYESIQKLWADWPEFHPDFMYEWDEKGHFRDAEEFLWFKDNERYYIEPKTFNHIPASGGGLGYTDFILTCEAVKREAWKVLSYRGFKFLDDFLDFFPDARGIYEQAVWDSHTSLFAKMMEMDIKEFLRHRALGRLF